MQAFRFLACHEIARALGPDRCIALPMFHALTGCDTVSCFSGRGKKTSWDTWNVYGNVTHAFCALIARPTQFAAYPSVIKMVDKSDFHD